MISLVHSLYPGDGVTFSVFTALVQIAAAVLLTMLLGNMFLRHRPAAEYAAWLTCLALAVVCPLIAMSAAPCRDAACFFPTGFRNYGHRPMAGGSPRNVPHGGHHPAQLNPAENRVCSGLAPGFRRRPSGRRTAVLPGRVNTASHRCQGDGAVWFSIGGCNGRGHLGGRSTFHGGAARARGPLPSRPSPDHDAA